MKSPESAESPPEAPRGRVGTITEALAVAGRLIASAKSSDFAQRAVLDGRECEFAVRLKRVYLRTPDGPREPAGWAVQVKVFARGPAIQIAYFGGLAE